MGQSNLRKGVQIAALALFILASLLIVVVYFFSGNLEYTRDDSTRHQLASIATFLDRYKGENYGYPDQNVGLLALVKLGESGYFEDESFLTDSWGNTIIYRTDGMGGFILYSAGPNGEDDSGGSDDIVVDR